MALLLYVIKTAVKPGLHSQSAVLLYWEAILLWMSKICRPMLYCELHLYSGLQRENGNSLYVMSIFLLDVNTEHGSLIVCDKHNDLGFIHDGGLSYVLSGAPYERYTLLC